MSKNSKGVDSMRLLMIVTDGFEDIEAIGTLAILRRANLDVTFASLNGSEATGRYGVSVKNLVDVHTVNFDDYDMLIIPGGPEYIVEEKDPFFLSMVKYFANKDKYIAAICAGPTILGHLGLLKNKKYTCFTSMNEDFDGTYLDQYVVIDDKLITARSCAASIDFGLAIVKVLLGDEKLEILKKSIYYEHN